MTMQCVVQLNYMQDIGLVEKQMEGTSYKFLIDNRGPCLVKDFPHLSSKPIILESVALDLIDRNIRMDSINVYTI